MKAQSAMELFHELVSVADDAIDLAEAALAIAQEEYPTLDRAQYLLALDDLGEAARPRVARESTVLGVANALSHLLFEEQQFRGNAEDYYDPRNSYLNDVLSRRLGIPITLGLVYIETARRAGVDAEGVGMPGHVIVRVRAHGETALVDPFHGGTLLTEDDCLALVSASTGYTGPFEPSFLEPMSKRDFLARMLNNLKQVYLNERDYPRALAAVERLVLLHPDDPHERRLRDGLRDVVYD